MSKFKERFSYIINKWTIAIALFVVYIGFMSDASVLNHIKGKQNLRELQQQEQFLKDKIENDKLRLNELQSNQKNLEKFAREQFYMHKENEDIFIIVEED